MKKLAFIICFFIPLSIFAQNVGYEALQLFLSKHTRYISFKNRHLLEASVNANYDKVKTFLDSKNENIEDYFVDDYLIVQTTHQGGELHPGSWIRFPIYHINTMYAWLKFKKENEEKYNQLNDALDGPYQMVGNASGKDGTIKINYATGKTSLEIWK